MQTFIKEEPKPANLSQKRSSGKKVSKVKVQKADDDEEDRKPGKEVVDVESSSAASEDLESKKGAKRSKKGSTAPPKNRFDSRLPRRSELEPMTDEEWREFVVKHKHIAGGWRRSTWSKRNPHVMSSYRRELELKYNPLIKLLGKASLPLSLIPLTHG